MGRRNPYAGRTELRDKCRDILDQNDDAIHCDDLLLLLNRNQYRIYAYEFEAMLPRLDLTKDDNQLIHKRRKRAKHGAHNQSEVTQTELMAEVN